VTIDTDKDTSWSDQAHGMHVHGARALAERDEIAVGCSGTFHIDLATNAQTSNIAESGSSSFSER